MLGAVAGGISGFDISVMTFIAFVAVSACAYAFSAAFA